MRQIADFAKIRGRDDAKQDIFKLVRDWLRSVKAGKWVLMLDNVGDADFLLRSRSVRQASTDNSIVSESFMELLPPCDHGSILITTRSEVAARRLVEDLDMIAIKELNDDDATLLLERKLGRTLDEVEAQDLVRILGCIPLAITQAAAYIRQMGRRCSVPQCLEKLRSLNESKKSALDDDVGDLRRDKEAINSIILTWQISFEHIATLRPSAAELLYLMSFCDRQDIPEALIRNREGSEEALAIRDFTYNLAYPEGVMVGGKPVNHWEARVETSRGTATLKPFSLANDTERQNYWRDRSYTACNDDSDSDSTRGSSDTPIDKDIRMLE